MKGTVKWAVGRALESGGDDGDARAFLAKTDPLLRSRARRRLQDEIEQVWIAEPTLESGPVLLDKVAKRIGATPTTAKRPFWWPTLVATVSVLALAGVAALVIATRDSSKGTPRFEKLPQTADAYVNGGRPISLGPIGEELFGELVLEFVLAADVHARENTSITELDLDKAQRKLLDSKFKPHIGDKVHAALVGLAESARATLEDGEGMWGDADELNEALAEAGLGYYIDDSTLDRRKGTTPILYSHIVERVQVYDIGDGTTEKVLWLRRLDKLSRRRTATGSTHANSKVALIRRNLVDEEVHDDIIPLLAPGAAYSLWPVPPSKPRPAEKDDLEALAGERTRAELAAAGVGAEDGARLSKLLAKRDDLVADLKSRAKQQRYTVATPRGYVVDVSRYKKLEPIIGTGILPEIERVNAELKKDENRTVYSRVRRLFVEAVEFHEIQHRLDYRRKGEAPPEALHKYLRRGHDGQEMSRFGRRLVTEYSAYLSSMANSKMPMHVLVRLSRFGFDERNWNSTYADVFVSVAESLCAAAGIEHGDFIANRSVQRLELARAMIKLLDREPAELSALAAKAWQTAFGKPVPRPVLRQR